jgi:hypothetical protein
MVLVDVRIHDDEGGLLPGMSLSAGSLGGDELVVIMFGATSQSPGLWTGGCDDLH